MVVTWPGNLRDRLSLCTRDVSGMYRYGGSWLAVRYVIRALLHGPRIIRTRSLMPADEAMPAGCYTFGPLPGGARLRIDSDADQGGPQVFSGARELFCRRVYIGQPGFEITSRDTVVDLGANIGLFTTLAAVYGRCVVAVEAQSGFLPFINRHLARNDVQHKAIIHHGLIGADTGVFSQSSGLASHWGETPPPLTMNELLDVYKLEHVDFLKIDIEGSEYAIFGSGGSDGKALDWLDRVDRIAAEVHPFFGDPEAIAQVLTGRGFHTTLMSNSLRPVSVLKGEPTGFLFANRRS